MYRRSAALTVSLLGAWIIAAGCTASGSNDRVNGVAFDLDAAGGGGSTVDVIAPSDGRQPPSTPDASPKTDSAVPDGAATFDATPPAIDADAVSDTGGGSDATSCTSTTALLGGNASSIFGATATGSGAFVTHALTGGLAATPALVAFGASFEALLAQPIDAGQGNALYGVGFSGGAWSALAPLGGAAAAIDAPAAAVVGTTLHGVYLDPQHLYFHATFASAWDTGSDPVRPSIDAAATAFGPVHASAAGTATQLVIAYEGNNLLPYAQTWTSGVGWDNGVALGSAPLLANTPMAIVALDTGASDLLAVYVDGEGSASGNNLHLFYALRTASTKAWSVPAMVNVNAFTQGAPALTSMSGGRALVAWLGQSGGVYGSVLTTSGAVTWSAPAQVSAATASATPSLAHGVCGDDAVAAYVSGGSIYTTHFAGGTWTAPAALPGETGMTAAAIATTP